MAFVKAKIAYVGLCKSRMSTALHIGTQTDHRLFDLADKLAIFKPLKTSFCYIIRCVTLYCITDTSFVLHISNTVLSSTNLYKGNSVTKSLMYIKKTFWPRQGALWYTTIWATRIG